MRPSPAGSTGASRAGEAPRGASSLFHDTFVTYNAPEVGRAAVELLEARGLRRRARGQGVLRPAADLQGHAGRGQVPRGVERRAARAAGGARRSHRGARAVVPAHAAGRVRWSWSAATTRARSRRSSFLLEEFLLRERSRGLAMPLRRTEPRGVRCCTAIATRRRWSAPRRRWPRSVGRLRGQRGGFRLLRHGGLVRLREGALRHLGDAGQPAARARGEGACRRTPRSSRPASRVASRSSTWPAVAPSIRPRCCGSRWPESRRCVLLTVETLE